MLSAAARALGWFQLPPPGALADKLAVVTGGSSGIGFEVASELAAKGATVVMASRCMERMRSAIADLAERDPSAAKNCRPM